MGSGDPLWQMLAFLALVGAEDVGAGFERYGLQEGEPGWAGVGLFALSARKPRSKPRGESRAHGERKRWDDGDR